jgi:response regulator of citrate/malate metabolism
MPGNYINICIVDDDTIYQFTAKKTIEAINFAGNVSSFFNGEDAMNFIKENYSEASALPDIIFLDINMPVMNGWQFLEAFNEVKADLCKPIHIYMVSSSVDLNDIRKSKEYYGVHDYIVKPIHRDRFKEILQPSASA